MSQSTTTTGILHFILETAIAAAYEAGAYLRSKQGNVHVLYKKSLRDDLLDADLEAEAIILKKLRTDSSTFGILSEETVKENEGASYQWLIDPLDGSANFQHGSPMFAVSIGLLFNTIPVLGVIYLPAHDEMFTAIHGNGAALNGHTIAISQVSVLNEAIIHLGDFAKSGNPRDNVVRIANITKLANTVGRVRMIGTAVTDLAYVACGRADALIMHSNHPWDIEAGRLILTEAGGNASTVQSESERDAFIYSNGCIHQELIELISTFK